MDGEMSVSDDDSISLLQDLPACQSKRTAVDKDAANSGSQAGNKEVTKKMKQTQQKTASCSGSSSQSAKARIPAQKQLHKRNEKGETLLHKACKKNDLAQVKMLIQAGINVNMEDYAGWTALHEASAVGAEAVVKELLRAGALVNARSCDGVLPLHDAVTAGHYQVVKLLLLNGSNPGDKSLGGLSAFDMAEKENVKELLMTFQASSVTQEKTCKGAAQCRQAGDTPSAPCFDSQGFIHAVTQTTNLQSRETGKRGEARKSTDVQLRKDEPTNNSHSVIVAAILEEVRRKHAEISTWSLTDLRDLDKFKEALLQTQKNLADVITKQRLEKEALAHRYRTVPTHFHKNVLKSHFLSLASCQQNLVEILKKQKQLEDVFNTTKAKILNQSLNCDDSVEMGLQLDHGSTQCSTPELLKRDETPSCHRDGEQSESCRPVTWTGDERAPTHPDLQEEKGSSCQSETQQLNNFKKKGKNALIQTRARDNNRYLHRLLQQRVLAPGSTLQLILKGKQHVAHVQANGSILSKGKWHRAPECWLESILRNNIPVSSTYALDKVTFRGKPLSYHIRNMEAKENTSQILQCSTDVPQNRVDSAPRDPTPVTSRMTEWEMDEEMSVSDHDSVSLCQDLPARQSKHTALGKAGNKEATKKMKQNRQKPETPSCSGSSSQSEAGSVNRLLKSIKVIHLVSDDEWAPSAVMDHYWNKLIKQTPAELEDWESDL